MILPTTPQSVVEKQTPLKGAPKKPPDFRGVLLIIMAISFILLFAFSKKIGFIEVDDDGTFRLSKARKAKLEKELAKLNEAEQYALTARENGWYQCFSCPDTSSIFLFRSEIWKYGVTVNGEKGRYGKMLPIPALLYVVQFKGPLQECLAEEKRKIYNYTILPENMRRSKPLIRPPGNKRDN